MTHSKEPGPDLSPGHCGGASAYVVRVSLVNHRSAPPGSHFVDTEFPQQVKWGIDDVSDSDYSLMVSWHFVLILPLHFLHKGQMYYSSV